MGRRRAESSGGACRARLRGGSPWSSPFAAGSRRRVPSAWGAAEPELGRCLQSATWGRFAMFFSLRRWFKTKGAVGLGCRRDESSGCACRARLGGGSPWSSRLPARSRRRVPSARGAAEPRARAVLALLDLGAARHSLLAWPLGQDEGRRRLGAPPSRELGRCSQSAIRGGSPCSSRFAAGSRRRAQSA